MFLVLFGFVLCLEEVLNSDENNYNVLGDSLDGLKYVNISKIKEENAKIEFNVVSRKNGEPVIIFLSDTLKNSIDSGESEIKGCTFFDDFIYIINSNTNISLRIASKLFTEDVILLGFFSGKECGKIHFTTYGKDNFSTITLLSRKHTCLYHMAKNQVIYNNGSVLTERDGIINDGQILKFSRNTSKIFNLNLDTTTSSVKNETGTRRSIKLDYIENYGTQQYVVTNESASYYYLFFNNYDVIYDQNEMIILVLVVIGMIISVIAYWVLGCCFGDRIEGYIDDRSNPFFQETLNYYK